MIRFVCDRCEKTLAVEDEFAGQKVECPSCGDMNIVPLTVRPSGTPQAAPASGAAGGANASEDERRVLFVRPSLVRSRPLLCALLGLGPLALAAGIQAATRASGGGVNTTVWWIALPLVGWGALVVVWLMTCMRVALEVTNKRVSRIDGLALRDRRDVFHRDVQSVTIRPRGVFDRVFNVGDLEISTDESDIIEVRIQRIARPAKVKAAIDSFAARMRKA